MAVAAEISSKVRAITHKSTRYAPTGEPGTSKVVTLVFGGEHLGAGPQTGAWGPARGGVAATRGGVAATGSPPRRPRCDASESKKLERAVGRGRRQVGSGRTRAAELASYGAGEPEGPGVAGAAVGGGVGVATGGCGGIVALGAG